MHRYMTTTFRDGSGNFYAAVNRTEDSRRRARYAIKCAMAALGLLSGRVQLIEAPASIQTNWPGLDVWMVRA